MLSDGAWVVDGTRINEMQKWYKAGGGSKSEATRYRQRGIRILHAFGNMKGKSTPTGNKWANNL